MKSEEKIEISMFNVCDSHPNNEHKLGGDENFKLNSFISLEYQKV